MTEPAPMTGENRPPNSGNPAVAILGGVPISVLDRKAAAAVMLGAALRHRRGEPPLFFTSANGEVIARIHRDRAVARLFADADQILADGQPLVIASRWLCRNPLPERAATTDLFHDVARLAEEKGATFYLFGASEEENAKAVAVVRQAYPRLNVVGHTHGYLAGDALEAKLAEINALAPDILWLGLGVPREQAFVFEHRHKLANVGLIKTSGGLFNHLSGSRRRAPGWIQMAGFEWLWRLLLEPRRLAWRYLTTNPLALYLMLRHSE